MWLSAAGWDHALAVDSSGLLWGKGCNSNGELRPDGIDAFETWTLLGLEIKLQPREAVVAVAAGEKHRYLIQHDLSLSTLTTRSIAENCVLLSHSRITFRNWKGAYLTPV